MQASIDRRIAVSSLCLLALLLPVGGCSGPVENVAPAVPEGTWMREVTTTSVNGTRMQRTYIHLSDQSDGAVVDSFFTAEGSLQRFDSVREIVLSLERVGDGYQRCLEVHRRDGVPVDTTLRYWYFFERNDSLHYLNGMRYVGDNVGLPGLWESTPEDLQPLGERTVLHFTADSVRIERFHPGAGLQSVHASGYHAVKDSLIIEGTPIRYGERYELYPGWAFYITSRASAGYARQAETADF